MFKFLYGKDHDVLDLRGDNSLISFENEVKKIENKEKRRYIYLLKGFAIRLIFEKNKRVTTEKKEVFFFANLNNNLKK